MVDFGQLDDQKIDSWPKVNLGKNVYFWVENENGPWLQCNAQMIWNYCELIIQWTKQKPRY